LLALDSQRWETLSHAFGQAWDIPDRLRQIAGGNTAQDPWGYLWAVLCHQMSIADAAYAAVPHLAALCAAAPAQNRRQHIELIAFIERCRQVRVNFVAEMPRTVASGAPYATTRR
jgi:hypothetical protein